MENFKTERETTCLSYGLEHHSTPKKKKIYDEDIKRSLII